ncbi:hypothetical protein BDV12DRAFT_161636 [Aspergillus spectabilis]
MRRMNTSKLRLPLQSQYSIYFIARLAWIRPAFNSATTMKALRKHKPSGRIKPVDLSSDFYVDPCAIPSTKDLEADAFDFRDGLT